MKTNRWTVPVAFAATTISVLSLLAAGCGGGDTNAVVSAPALGTGTTGSAFAGRYVSTLALGEGQTGAVDFTVAADNTATGTLTVTNTAQTRQTQAFSFGAGTYAIQGTVNSTTGVFTMSGTVDGQPFSFAGTLPAPGNNYVGGSYTLTAGGQTYTGSFGSTSATPTPTVTPMPTPTSTTTPGPTPTPTSVTGQRFVGQITGVSSDYNGQTSTIDSPQSAASTIGDGVTPNFTSSAAQTNERSVQFTVTTLGGVTAPGTFPVGTGTTLATVFYNDGLARGWVAVSGSVVVESVENGVMRFRFDNVRMEPSRRFGSTLSQGTFTFTGGGNARQRCTNEAACQ